jgi:hypothetical protein
MPQWRDGDRRIATILLTAELYGPQALLPPLGLGPATCPVGCPYCPAKSKTPAEPAA